MFVGISASRLLIYLLIHPPNPRLIDHRVLAHTARRDQRAQMTAVRRKIGREDHPGETTRLSMPLGKFLCINSLQPLKVGQNQVPKYNIYCLMHFLCFALYGFK